jgi:hypothetical protein
MTKLRFPPKTTHSIASEPWKNDNPFGPPRVHHSFPNGGIKRLRDTLSKLSPSALAEKEELRKKNQYKIPLTHRNVDNFVTDQQIKEACRPNHTESPELQVVKWLERVS